MFRHDARSFLRQCAAKMIAAWVVAFVHLPSVLWLTQPQ
jgi:hypothetical protein